VTVLGRLVDVLHGGKRVDALAPRIAEWGRCEAVSLQQPHAALRYVVVDVETSGLDVKADRLIAIGAAGVPGGQLRFDDTFGVVLRQRQASAYDNILIHRIGGEAQMAGADPEHALVDFLEFAGKAPLVAFHADFDRTMLERAFKEALGLRARSAWIDAAALLPALYPDTKCVSLDDWLAHFRIEGIERHDPVADAWATAELFLIALAAADGQGMKTAQGLLAVQKAHRWLGRHG
jgi:DNA polymerase-3 subunit epsilon